ncbi:hypothetical protein ANAEL_03684 [Anaerolineales bacterium]|nr:hypothetical protein ANAEL_03684 [Anaerolineales bacterium]
MRLITTVARCLGTALGLLLATTVGVAASAELPGYANLVGTGVSGPGWGDIFDSSGKVKDLKGGVSAAFIEDNISSGVATDMSKLISADIVDNGTVQPVNDLGNAYVYRTADAAGNLVLFAGVECLGMAEGTSYIDFEFSQDKIQVWSGIPWQIHGQKTAGDLTVRLNFVNGALQSVEFKQLAGDGSGESQILKTDWPVGGQACTGSNGLYAFCAGTVITGLAPTNSDVWNLKGTPVLIPAADQFVEVGINVGRLLGSNPDYSSLTLRTPEDIAFGTGLLLRRD